MVLLTLAYSAMAGDAPIVSFGTLPALQVTTPIPGSMHTPDDFNGDGTSDLLWFNPSLSQLNLWTMTATVTTGEFGGGVTQIGSRTYTVTNGYFVGAVGDFNGDGYADLVFTSANRDLYLWTNNQHGGWTSTYITTYPSGWQLIGAGDINGDGYDDLLWLNPSACEFAYWTMQGVTRIGYKIIPVACGYYPVSIGYYTPTNRLSIVWTSAANDLYIWDSTGSGTGGTTGNGFNAYDLTSYVPAGSRLLAIGGGYEGQGIGLMYDELSTDGTYDSGQGWLLSRTFDANGNQTGTQLTSVWGGGLVNTSIGSAGYVIAGNGVNNTGIYYFDPKDMVISTAGLPDVNDFESGNAPAPPPDTSYPFFTSWSYTSGWWVVGALPNGTVAPPWQ
ncbi:FG-GAP repeat domain-containing protein [Dyella dinghuensis]|nr:VCBS repeat-containing protein [Dyella dinghuensis]